MKSDFRIIVIFLFLLLVAACGKKPTPLIGKYYTGALFGKPISIDAVGDSTDHWHGIDSIIQAFEQAFDVNRPQSVISRINAYTRRDSVFCFNDSTKVFGMVYDLTRDLNAATQQYYDPTMGPLRRAWIVAKSGGLPEPDLDSIYNFVGFDGAKLDLNEMFDDSLHYKESQVRKADPRIEADFTLIAAALAIDHIGEYLKGHGVKQYRIRYGRDILTHGADVDSLNIVTLGVAQDSTDQAIRLQNMAFSSRNNNDKPGMIDPTYGYPVENEMVYVAVAAPSMVEAAVYSETFMMMGLEKAGEYYTENPETRVQSFMFYMSDSILHSASTIGFDSMLIAPDSTMVEE
ncbi:MAG: FAD:protein FMN transferase [Flavobacteriales bacterium]|nr:FAD:protein FMN transferase [Flavobacteriales bacterium]